MQIKPLIEFNPDGPDGIKPAMQLGNCLITPDGDVNMINPQSHTAIDLTNAEVKMFGTVGNVFITKKI